MKRMANLSATQIASLGAIGAIIAASSFAVMSAAHLNQGHGTPMFLFRALLSIFPLPLGLALNIWAYRQLEDGIASERWPDQKIDRIRAFFKTRLWRAFILSLVIAMIVVLVPIDRDRDLRWSLIIFVQGLTWLGRPFRIQSTQPTPSLVDLRAAPRLQSQSWGQPWKRLP